MSLSYRDVEFKEARMKFTVLGFTGRQEDLFLAAHPYIPVVGEYRAAIAEVTHIVVSECCIL